MKRTVLLAAGLLALALPRGSAAGEADVADLLPADAILSICIYGDNPDIDQTAMAQMLQEPEVQEWLTSVRQAVASVTQLAGGFLGANVASLKPLLGRRFGIAVLRGGAGPPDILVVARVGAEGPARGSVEQFFSQLAQPGGPKQDVRGVTVMPLRQGGCFGFRDGLLFASSSTETLGRVLAGETPRLASLPGVQRAQGMGSTPVALIAYNHVALMETLGPAIPEGLTAFLGGAGLGQADMIVARVGAKGRALVGTGMVRTRGERTGLLKALAAEPVDQSLLKLCPRDADIAWAANLDPEELYAAVLDMVHPTVGAAMDADVRGGLREFEAAAGVRLRDDLFASLGRGIVVTTSGKSLVPALIVSAPLEDAERFEESLEKLVAHLDKQIKARPRAAQPAVIGPGEPAEPPEEPWQAGAELKTVAFGDHTIRYLATPGFALPLAPCYARVGGRAFFATSPVHLKDYLAFLDAGEPSILDHPGFKTLAEQVPENAISVGYSDVGEAFLQLYSFMGPMLTFVHGIPNMPVAVDFANLPSKRTLRKHLFGSISYTVATEDALVYECQSPFGVPFIGPAPAGLPAVAVGGVMAGMMLPALGRARQQARLIRDRNNLNQIMKGLATYLNEHGDNRFYPRSLGELWDRKVLPDPGVFVSPLDDNPPKLPNGLPCSYESCFDRHPNRIFRDDWPPNQICVWDRKPFARGQRSVAFFDSHVEVMDEARFVELLRLLDEQAKQLEEREDKRGEF